MKRVDAFLGEHEKPIIGFLVEALMTVVGNRYALALTF